MIYFNYYTYYICTFILIIILFLYSSSHTLQYFPRNLADGEINGVLISLSGGYAVFICCFQIYVLFLGYRPEGG